MSVHHHVLIGVALSAVFWAGCACRPVCPTVSCVPVPSSTPVVPTLAAEALASWAVPVSGATLVDGWPSQIRRTRDGAVMVLIPAGTFWMGRTHAADRELNDTPRHQVRLTRPYYLDRAEVTVGQWKSFAAARPGVRAIDLDDVADDHPIRGVPYEDALAYAEWVACSLPTEAQWERAARGGAPRWRYPWGDEDDVRRRNGAGAEDGFAKTAPVRSFPANGYGLHDMSGNVWEWCRDWYRPGSYTAAFTVDPTGPDSGHMRVIRGGNALSGQSKLRVSFREGRGRDILDYVGFRLARVVEKEPR